MPDMRDGETLLLAKIKGRIWPDGEEPTAEVTAGVEEKTQRTLKDYSDQELDALVDAVFTEQDARK